MLRRFIGQGAFFWEIRWIAKSNFRKGGANLPVCLDSPQGIATISEIAFGDCSSKRGMGKGARLDGSAAQGFLVKDSPATLERVDRLFGVQRAQRGDGYSIH